MSWYFYHFSLHLFVMPMETFFVRIPRYVSMTLLNTRDIGALVSKKWKYVINITYRNQGPRQRRGQGANGLLPIWPRNHQVFKFEEMTPHQSVYCRKRGDLNHFCDHKWQRKDQSLSNLSENKNLVNNLFIVNITNCKLFLENKPNHKVFWKF